MSTSNHCRHFTGLQNETCQAGIVYETVRPAAGPLLAGWPCLGNGGCDQFEPYTDEELAEQDRELEQFLARLVLFQSHEIDACPHCDKHVAVLHKVGRCTYGDCGCRLWQGNIPVAWR